MQFNFVVASNERAVRLWQSLSFEIVGRNVYCQAGLYSRGVHSLSIHGQVTDGCDQITVDRHLCAAL
jgi:hypothetical protein